jgi:SMP-30/Gluconolactonase/LRE-like region
VRVYAVHATLHTMTHPVHYARRGVAAAAFVFYAAISLNGSSAKFFQSANQADFLKGDVENLSIDARGQLMLGPATELIYETPSPFLWAVVPAPDGSLFVGTGNDGRVYRVDAQGHGTPFFDAAELEIHAIALAPDGGLYVGSSPDGKIYKVDRNGRGTTFFDPEEKYIWALATDANGNVYAATGEKGVVYKIGRDGKGTPFYQTKATHATALLFDKAGNLIVGTESPGRVFRVDASGKGFVLLDTPFQEIRSLRFDAKGMLFAAAVNGRSTGGNAPTVPADSGTPAPTGDSARAPVPSVSVSTEITAVAVADSSGSGASSGSTREDRRSAKGAVYRIAPDGLWDQLWESRDDSPYDLTFDTDGRLVIGTGAKGKIYRLEGDPLQPTLIARASAQQVTAMHTDARGRLYYATANPGKLFRLSAQRSPKGTYESEVRDAQMVSTWGAISWRGSMPSGSHVELFSRTGNTEAPDETWSAWSSAYTVANGSPIVSPKARYLQWRAVLSGSGDGPVLTSVSAAYLQRNLRPEVRSVTIHPPGIVFQKPYSTGDPDLAGFDNQSTPDRRLMQAAQSPQQSSGGSPSLGRRTYQKGLQTLAWRAEDENEDDLSYDVQYRKEGETTWKVLRSAVTDPILVWDTATVPNGTYFVRVIASDAPSNSAENALTGELDSTPFDIDNTPPAITIGSVRMNNGRTVVTFDVNDDQSPVQRAECSQDGILWRSVFPADGIADSRSEHYVVTIEGALGPAGLTLRVTDVLNNVITTQVARPAAP